MRLSLTPGVGNTSLIRLLTAFGSPEAVLASGRSALSAHLSRAQCEALLNLAVEACEYYYPAFQFVLWGGKTAEEAVAAAILECQGQA